MFDNNITITGMDILKNLNENQERIMEHMPEELKGLMDLDADKDLFETMKKDMEGMSLSFWLPEMVADYYKKFGKDNKIPEEVLNNCYEGFKRNLKQNLMMLMVIVIDSIKLGEATEVMENLMVSNYSVLTNLLIKTIAKTIEKHYGDRHGF